MTQAETTPPAEASQDPPQDRATTSMPHNVAIMLRAVGRLLGFGHHLLETLRLRAAAPNFNAIAACFGTANLATILAHLNRGLLRAEALERVLLARAATGKELDIPDRRIREPKPAPAETEPGQPAAQPATPKRAPRPSLPAGWDNPEFYMPTLEELERQIRRRPIGRTVTDICLDLGVIPEFCHPGFWDALFQIMHHFGGSVVKLMQTKFHREKTFIQQQDRVLGSNWDWLRLQRDGHYHQILGFFIGEPPVNPLDPAAAIATAPP